MPAASNPRRRLLRLLLAIVACAVIALALAWLSAPLRARALNALLWVVARIDARCLVAVQDRLSGTLPPGTVLLVGDSIMALAPARAIDPLAINYGIGASEIADARAQLAKFKSWPRLRALVIHVGTNDLRERAPDAAETEMRRLLATIPESVTVIVCTVTPIDPARRADRSLAKIATFNRALADYPAMRRRTIVAATNAALAGPGGALRSELDGGDGLHLSPAGERAFAAAVREALPPVVP